MNNRLRKWFVLFALIAVWSMMMSCYISGESESMESSDFRYYTIDPATLLESLDRGDTDAFKLFTTTAEAMPTPFPYTDSVSWSQTDYFRVAQALYQQAWQEPLEAQNIYYMSFRTNCAEIEQGLFSWAKIDSFKVVQTGKEETRIEYRNSIWPSNHSVTAFKWEYTPNINKWEPLDLTQFQISAKEAIQIAEKSGGAEKRLKYENDCRITAIALGSKGNVWDVSYRNNRDGRRYTIFNIAVDAQTGSFEVLHPKP